MKAVNNSVDKEFAKEILQLIDDRHKEELRRVDSKYRSLKDSLENWSKEGAGLYYELDWIGLKGEENEENLERLMEELRAD
jgi:hypothetical protein